MSVRRAVAAAGITVLTLLASATTASAATPSPDDTGGTVVIGGRTLGPAQGLSVVEETYVETPGTTPVGFNPPAPAGTVTPMWVSGSSYAYSVEHLELFYTGYGRAGGNVVNGQRIVRVCFWWTRAGATSSNTYCADAAYSGGHYSPGPEVMGSYDDSLNPNAPTTYFHVAVTRIDPNV